MPYVHEEIVERKKWISTSEFTELISLGQILPGANVTNFAAMFGYRMAGWKGASAAVAGLLTLPFGLLLLLYHFYKFYSNIPQVEGALQGVLAVSSAMILSMAYKMIATQKSKRIVLSLSLICLICASVLQLPIIYTLLIMGPLTFLTLWIQKSYFRKAP